MKLAELKKVIQEYQYFDDTNVIDATLSSIIANRLKIGDPVWLIVIGASSGGKSQIIRPITQSDNGFMHQVDDMTENTFLSGAKLKGGAEASLLLREDGIGKHGMISISDLTILLSKSGDARAVIMSQFRALFDGEMTKHSGNMEKPLHWEGYLGVIAGSTPSVYTKFEEFSDLGERFIYYRMKEFSAEKATSLALSRTLYGSELNDKLSEAYLQYTKSVIQTYKGNDIDLTVPDEVKERLINISVFAETVRTAIQKDWKGEHINRIPVPAYPMRVALQLIGITKAFMLMQFHETGSTTLSQDQLNTLDWIGYSLANEEKRACLKILASATFTSSLSTQIVADEIGLETEVVNTFLQNLTAVGILSRSGASNSLGWSFKNENHYNLVRRIETIEKVIEYDERELTNEESSMIEMASEESFRKLDF